MKESIFVDRLGKPVLRVLNQVARRFEASPKASSIFFFLISSQVRIVKSWTGAQSSSETPALGVFEMWVDKAL